MSIEGNGILKQIQNSNTGTTVTNETIYETLKSLYLNTKQQTKQFILYTGLKGAETFNFVMMFGDSFVCSWWFNYFKYKKSLYKYDIYLNVIRKHSLYKVLVEKLEKEQLGSNYKFTLLKGTQTVSWHYNIKSLNKELAKLVEEADLEDLKRKQEREIRIANYGK